MTKEELVTEINRYRYPMYVVEDMAHEAKRMRDEEPYATTCDDYIDGYLDGANAIINIIDKLYNHCRDYQLYRLLGLKLKELKGEKE